MPTPRKVTAEQALAIRATYTADGCYGAGMQVLAQRYEVSVGTIHRVLTGQHPSAAGLPNVSGRRQTLTWDKVRRDAPSRRVRELGPASAQVAAAHPKRRPCPRCNAKPGEACTDPRFAQYPKPIASFHRARRTPTP